VTRVLGDVVKVEAGKSCPMSPCGDVDRSDWSHAICPSTREKAIGFCFGSSVWGPKSHIFVPCDLAETPSQVIASAVRGSDHDFKGWTLPPKV
jgi:hypothetical protein